MRMFRVSAAVAAALVLPWGLARPFGQSPSGGARPAYAEPSISADGSQIAFVSGGDIWTVAASGGQAHLVVSGPANDTHPVFSPDKARLAFTSTRTGGGDIYILTFATSEIRRLTFDDGPEQLDGWSHDGRWIYFFSSGHDISGMNDIYRVSPEGGTPLAVSADRYASEYFSMPSPDGRTLAMTARGIVSGQWWRHGHSHLDESEIWLHDLDVPETPAAWRPVTTGSAKDAWPMWSSDARSLYFVSDRNGAENVWKVPVAGGAATAVTHFTDGRVLWPSIAAVPPRTGGSGEVIAFERDFAIWTLDTASGQAAPVSIAREGAPAGPAVEHLRLSNQLRHLRLSPDGKKLVFTARGDVFAASAKDGGDAVRVTSTPAGESDLAWAPDSRRIAYASARHGAGRLYLYDFGSEKERELTSSGSRDLAPVFSPDGKSIAFVREGKELHVIDVESRADRILARGFVADEIDAGRPIAWSPDSRWLAYFNAGARGFTNVSVVAASGGDGRAVSFLANTNSTAVVWSPDGSFLLFDTGQRTEPGDLARVNLKLEAPKFREDQFRDLFNEQNTPRRTDAPSSSPGDTDAARRDTVAAPGTPPDTPPNPAGRAAAGARPVPPPPITIVFDDIRRRLSLLPVGLDVGQAFISPDGKTAVLIATSGGQQNLYSWSLDELSKDRPVARQLTSTSGAKADVSFAPDSKDIFYLDAGRIETMSLEKRESRAVNVTAELDVDFQAEKMAVFDEAWRLLRDNFFDPAFNGVDWTAARARYEPYVAGATTPDEMRRVVSLMIGELNASHMGISAPPGAAPPTVGHLGLDFDRRTYETSGRLRVAAVIPLGPAALAGSIAVGDEIASVDGEAVGRGVSLDERLQNKIDRRVVLGILSAGRAHDVALRPIGQAAEKSLRYRQWVEHNRAYVARVSGNRLGYVHMPDMSADSLAQLYVDLDAENVGRAGVVVDIRNNTGGFVNAYAIDILARRPYLNMTLRGQPTVPARSALGQRALERPTVLVTNQHSLSDAEDFTQGYRSLGLGKVVGEPTAGWIIYTWNTRLIDGSVLRLPRTRITDSEGQPLERHPRPVDVEVRRPIGESYGPDDAQLRRAVEVLLKQIG